MSAKEADIARLTKIVRLCFQRLKALGDELHAELGMNASLRAILEALAEQGPQTVPHMAEMKSVSRQHIQKHVDMLIASGHVELRPNPAHKRSSVLAISEKGATVFAEMQKRESHILAALAASADGEALPQAIGQLQAFTEVLKRFIEAEGQKDES